MMGWVSDGWTWFTAASTWGWFIAPFEGQSWWDFINSPVFGVAVGALLAQRVGRVAKETAVATALKEAERAEQAADVALNDDEDEASPGPQGDRQTRYRASMAIRRLKDYVEATADRVQDGRTKRKYDNITRRDYRVITEAIAADAGLSDADRSAIHKGFDDWRTYKNGKVEVPEDVARSFERLAERYRVTPNKPAKWKPKRSVEAA